MEKLIVKDIMTKYPITCNPNTPLFEVAKIMALAEINAVIVVTPDNKNVGIITQIDLLTHFTDDLTKLTAQDIMTRKLIDITYDESVEQAAQNMVSEKVHRLIVIDPLDPVKAQGVISASDLILAMAGEK
jgi:CBS domain-containing protein